MNLPTIMDFDDFINDYEMLLVPMYDTGKCRLLPQLFPSHLYPRGAETDRLRGVADTQE